MKTSIHYVIDNARILEDKADVKLALKSGAKVVKVIRTEYQTGPTTAILATLTEITKAKDI